MNRQNTSLLKILFVCDAFWPYVGGAERSALTVLKSLAKQDLEISVLTHQFYGTKLQENIENLSICRKRFFSPKSLNPLTIDFFHRLLFYLKAVLVISKYVHRNRPDLILTQQLISTSAIVVSKLFHIPIVVTVHDYWPICYNRNLILKYSGEICSNYDTSLCNTYRCARNEVRLFLRQPSFLEPLSAIAYSIFMFIHTLIAKQSLKKANAIITVSNFVKRTLVSNGVDPKKIRVIYNPVTANSQLETRPRDTPQILYIGRLDFEKGVNFLLKAMQRICTKIEPVRLIIVGKGSDENSLRALAKSLRIDRHVKFLGRISENLLLHLYQSSTVIVVPSIWPEPFGIVVAEAIMLNRPVVASDVGGISELIDPKTGVLVPPRDSDALCDATLSVMMNTVSFENKQTIRKEFSPDHIAAQYLAVVKSVT